MNTFGTIWFMFLCAMTWNVFGIIAFGVAFQWIMLLFWPPEWNFGMQAFISVWSLFGIWYFFIRKEKP